MALTLLLITSRAAFFVTICLLPKWLYYINMIGLGKEDAFKASPFYNVSKRLSKSSSMHTLRNSCETPALVHYSGLPSSALSWFDPIYNLLKLLNLPFGRFYNTAPPVVSFTLSWFDPIYNLLKLLNLPFGRFYNTAPPVGLHHTSSPFVLSIPSNSFYSETVHCGLKEVKKVINVFL